MSGVYANKSREKAEKQETLQRREIMTSIPCHDLVHTRNRKCE